MIKNLLLLLLVIHVCVLSSCNRQHKHPQVTTTAGPVKYCDSTQTMPGVVLLDMVTACELIDRHGNSLKKYPFGLIKLLDDGTLLGRADSLLVKLDKDLNILWKIPFRYNLHHEITVDDNGNIYSYGSETHPFMGLQVRFDVVYIFSPEGKLIYEWSVYDHLEEFVSVISKSAWLRHLPRTLEQSGSLEKYIQQDPIRFIVPTDADCDCAYEFSHFNALQVLPQNKVAEQIPAFKKGNLLMSFHPYSCYGILDTATRKIEWVGYLPERTKLHSPHLTSEGTMLVFQNCTSAEWTPRGGFDSLKTVLLNTVPHETITNTPDTRLWTSITEYNPLTNQKIWEYTAEPKESMCATSRGSAQRLPNGNTLVCANTKEKGGRVFELNPDKRIVWEYIYPELDTQDSVPLGFYRVKWMSLEMAEKFITGTKH